MWNLLFDPMTSSSTKLPRTPYDHGSTEVDHSLRASTRMDASSRLRRSHWLIGLLLGTLTGLLVLGVGGRLAMRGIALYTGGPAVFSVGGSLAVIAVGAVCGAGGGVLLVLLKWLCRSRLLRGGVFWLLIGLVTYRGLHPLNPIKLTAFVPLAVMYGAVLQVVWCRRYRPQPAEAAIGAARQR
jgi:hypothetical protein